MSDPAASSSPAESSVEFVVYRLARWATNAPHGVAYVAYGSPNVRATAEARFASDIQAEGLSLDRLDLTAFSTVPEAIAALGDKIATTEADVLSVTGFAGFLRNLGEDWTSLNYRREDWFRSNILQVWWVPAAYDVDFARRAPDLYSWFLVRERLIGSAPGANPLPDHDSTRKLDPEKARKRSGASLRRFDRSFAQKADLATVVGFATDAVRPLYESGLLSEAHSTAASLIDRLEHSDYGATWHDSVPSSKDAERKIGLAALAMRHADREIARRVLASLTSHALTALSPPLQAEAYLTRGMMAKAYSEFEQARADLTTAAKLSMDASMPVNAANALLGLAEITLSSGDLQEADNILSVSFHLYELSGDALGQATVLMQRGQVAYHLGDYEQALNRYEKARTLYDSIGQTFSLANLSILLGMLHMSRGNCTAARMEYGRSLAIYEELGNTRGRANSLASLGQISIQEGKLDEATSRLEDALALYRVINDPMGEANALWLLGQADSNQQHDEAAIGKLSESLLIYQQLGMPTGVARVQLVLGQLWLRAGDWTQAHAHLTQAKSVFELHHEPLGLAEAQHHLAHLLFEEGKVAEAREEATAALRGFKAVSNATMIERTSRLLARVRGQEASQATQ